MKRASLLTKRGPYPVPRRVGSCRAWPRQRNPVEWGFPLKGLLMTFSKGATSFALAQFMNSPARGPMECLLALFAIQHDSSFLDGNISVFCLAIAVFFSPRQRPCAVAVPKTRKPYPQGPHQPHKLRIFFLHAQAHACNHQQRNCKQQYGHDTDLVACG